MPNAIEWGLIVAGVSVVVVAVVGGIPETKNPKIIPSDYTINTTEEGLKEQVGPVKKGPAGIRTLVFKDEPEGERLAFLSCEAPQLQDGKVKIHRYVDTRGRVYFAACP